MNSNKIKVLLIMEQCNPEMPSVPLVGYEFFNGISQLVDVTLVTHERNKQAIEKAYRQEKIIYINEKKSTAAYYRWLESTTIGKKGTNWPLLNAFGYLIYAEFNHKVYQLFKTKVLQGEYDIIHAITPMMPRYPVKLIQACKYTPFLLGPVNGGVPFPKGFRKVARKEFAYFNFLRTLGLFIPGYTRTYKTADKILVGSTFTLEMLQKRFRIPDKKIELFYENGIADNFFDDLKATKTNDKIKLLFVGRLVPYKGADVVVDAISKLSEHIKDKIKLTIVGDGPERDNLNQQVQELGISKLVSFAGWVNQKETVHFYKEADIFCFPSIREFGGAVVLEAMACGLPCIIADNGGIAEYVTTETGFKIVPTSREYLTQELTNKIEILVENGKLRQTMSAKAIERAREFTWKKKAKEIVRFYEQLIIDKTKYKS